MGERVEEAIVGRKKNQSLKIVCVELEMCGGFHGMIIVSVIATIFLFFFLFFVWSLQTR